MCSLAHLAAHTLAVVTYHLVAHPHIVMENKRRLITRNCSVTCDPHTHTVFAVYHVHELDRPQFDTFPDLLPIF
jgi:hypothetical protein